MVYLLYQKGIVIIKKITKIFDSRAQKEFVFFAKKNSWKKSKKQKKRESHHKTNKTGAAKQDTSTGIIVENYPVSERQGRYLNKFLENNLYLGRCFDKVSKKYYLGTMQVKQPVFVFPGITYERRVYMLAIYAHGDLSKVGKSVAFTNRGKLWRQLQDYAGGSTPDPLYFVNIDAAGRIYTGKQIRTYRTFMRLFPVSMKKAPEDFHLYVNQVHSDLSITTYKISVYATK